MAANNFFTAIPRNEDALTSGNKYLLIGRYLMLNPSSNLTVDASGYFYFNSDASAEFTKIYPRQETLQTTENTIANLENGAVLWEQTVAFNLAHRTLTKRNQLVLMAKYETIIVVVDFTGTGRVYGAEEGMKLNTAPITSGFKLEDWNGYSFEFKGRSAKPASYLTSTELESIVLI